MAGEVEAAGLVGGPAAAAGVSLVTGLIKAKQERKRRKAEARAKVGEAVTRAGEKKGEAIQNIIGNLRAATR